VSILSGRLEASRGYILLLRDSPPPWTAVCRPSEIQISRFTRPNGILPSPLPSASARLRGRTESRSIRSVLSRRGWREEKGASGRMSGSESDRDRETERDRERERGGGERERKMGKGDARGYRDKSHCCSFFSFLYRSKGKMRAACPDLIRAED